MSTLYALIARHADYHQHADAPSAHQPHPLSRRGRTQATQAGATLDAWIAQEGWTLAREIHCSSLLRAWQTACLIRDQLGTLGRTHNVSEFDALCERSVGALANLTRQQIDNVLAQDPRCPPLPADWKARADFRLPVPGAESLAQAGQRVAEHIRTRMRTLHEQSGHENAQLFVGHGAALRHAAHSLGVLSARQIPRLSMHHASMVCLKWTPQTDTWQHHRGDWKVRPDGDAHTD